MRLDKRNFPPLGLLDVENIYLDIPDSMALIRENFEAFKSPIYDLIIEGKSNILTSTENAQDYMRSYSNGCVETYMKDNNKKAFGGAYIEMNSPFPSIDFYMFNPMKRRNKVSGKNEEVIVCSFMTVQGMGNTVISIGKIVLSDYSNSCFKVEPDFVCINEKEEDLTINYMLFLLELNCFIEYGRKSDKNILKIRENQRINLLDGNVIDNRSEHLIKCLLPPKRNKA